MLLEAITTITLIFSSFNLTNNSLASQPSDKAGYELKREFNYVSNNSSTLIFQDGVYTKVVDVDTEYTLYSYIYYNRTIKGNSFIPLVNTDFNVYLDMFYTKSTFRTYTIYNGNMQLDNVYTRNWGTDIFEFTSDYKLLAFGLSCEQEVEADKFVFGMYIENTTYQSSIFNTISNATNLYEINYDYTTGDRLFNANRFVVDMNQVVISAWETVAQDTYHIGYQDGETAGYNKGYEAGVENATEFSIPALINSIFNAPVAILGGMLDFEILGINIKNLVFFLLTVGIIAWIVSVFKGGKK